ncbi:hypothetical protein GQ568_00360 [Patescibacteria group bacterium]|nr:hypothetical protein [Patescibacteria group bacterium]
MISEYKNYLNKFQHKAIFIEPLKKYSSYCYYTFEEIIEEDYWPRKGIEKLRSLIEKSSNCVKCEKETFLLLCSSKIYHNNPLKPFDVNKIDSNHYRHLCVDCLCDDLKKIIIRENIYFKSVYLIMEKDGLATSFSP